MSPDIISVDAVFGRISELYRADSDAAIGRKLGGLSNQSVYTYRKRGTVPYGHIIEHCPPADWEYIFTGRRPPEPREGVPLPLMIQAVLDAGYRVEKAAQPPRSEAEGSP